MKELRVELLDPGEHACTRDVVRIPEALRREAGRQQLGLGESGDALDPVAQISPERTDVARSRKASTHSYERDGIRRTLRTRHRHHFPLLARSLGCERSHSILSCRMFSLTSNPNLSSSLTSIT